jgi:hypothetical protein
VPQAFLEAGEQGFVVASFDVDHAVRMKADLSDCRRKQILARHAPQHLALRPGRNSRCKKLCGSAIDRTIAAAGNLMERAHHQATSRQVAIKLGNAKRQDRSTVTVAVLKATNALLKAFHNGSIDGHTHASCNSIVS